MLARLRRELRGARIVMLTPASVPRPMVRPPLPSAGNRSAPLPPKPLDKPDPRILNRLEPELSEFVRENPEIESILTREIVRDLDSKVLDVQELLKKSSIEVSFGIDETGKIVGDRIEKSSKVPSIDHMAVEVIRLLEKYQFFSPMKGMLRVHFSVHIAKDVQIVMTGKAGDELAAEEARKQLQNVVTILRFALTKEAAEVLLSDVELTTKDGEVVFTKSLEKDSLVNLLLRYYRSETKTAKPD